MKTKALIFVGVAAIATLSFTFVKPSTEKYQTEKTVDQSAPVGGVVANEIVK